MEWNYDTLRQKVSLLPNYFRHILTLAYISLAVFLLCRLQNKTLSAPLLLARLLVFVRLVDAWFMLPLYSPKDGLRETEKVSSFHDSKLYGSLVARDSRNSRNFGKKKRVIVLLPIIFQTLFLEVKYSYYKYSENITTFSDSSFEEYQNFPNCLWYLIFGFRSASFRDIAARSTMS